MERENRERNAKTAKENQQPSAKVISARNAMSTLGAKGVWSAKTAKCAVTYTAAKTAKENQQPSAKVISARNAMSTLGAKSVWNAKAAKADEYIGR